MKAMHYPCTYNYYQLETKAEIPACVKDIICLPQNVCNMEN